MLVKLLVLIGFLFAAGLILITNFTGSISLMITYGAAGDSSKSSSGILLHKELDSSSARSDDDCPPFELKPRILVWLKFLFFSFGANLLRSMKLDKRPLADPCYFTSADFFSWSTIPFRLELDLVEITWTSFKRFFIGENSLSSFDPSFL